MFGSQWDKGRATIVARNPLPSHSDGAPVYEFVGDVRMPDRPPFRATIQTPRIATDFWNPKPGDVIDVLIRAKDSKVKFDKDDPQISFKAYQARLTAGFDDTKAQQPGTPAVYLGGFTGAAGSADARAQAGDLADILAAQLAQLQQPGPAGSPTQPAGSPAQPTPAAGADPAVRIGKLEKLRALGMLTDDEFAAQRQRILDDI
jgi:hypothetical protein